MNGELRPISVSEMGRLLALPEADMVRTIEVAKASDPLLAGLYDGQLVCVLGFISLSLLSDRAYLWLTTTELAVQHKVAIGRWARRLLPEALRRYPTLIGHCSPDSRWLQSLGAHVVGNQFEIVL